MMHARIRHGRQPNREHCNIRNADRVYILFIDASVPELIIVSLSAPNEWGSCGCFIVIHVQRGSLFPLFDYPIPKQYSLHLRIEKYPVKKVRHVCVENSQSYNRHLCCRSRSLSSLILHREDKNKMSLVLLGLCCVSRMEKSPNLIGTGERVGRIGGVLLSSNCVASYRMKFQSTII